MAVHYGRGTWVGVGEQTAYGTLVARTAWYRVVSISGGRVTEKEMVQTLAEAAGSWAYRRTYTSRIAVRLTVRLRVTYDGFGLWWKHAMYSASTSGTGPYTHTYEMGPDIPAGLTIEVIRGTAAASEVYDSCLITRMDARCVAGDTMELEVELIGRTSAARSARSTPSVTGAEDLVLHHHAGTLSWNGRSLRLREFRFTLDHGLAVRQHLGELTIAQPNPGGMIAPTVEAKLDSDTTDGDGLYQDAHDDDAGDLTLTFASGAQSLSFWLYNAKLLESKDTDISSVDVIEHAVRWVGLSDGSDEAAAIVATNASSSATAPP